MDEAKYRAAGWGPAELPTAGGAPGAAVPVEAPDGGGPGAVAYYYQPGYGYQPHHQQQQQHYPQELGASSMAAELPSGHGAGRGGGQDYAAHGGQYGQSEQYNQPGPVQSQGPGAPWSGTDTAWGGGVR